MSTSSELSARIFRLQAEVDLTLQQLQAAINSNNLTLERVLNTQLQVQQSELSLLRNQLNDQGDTSTVSSGSVIAEAQQARDDGAVVSNPFSPVGRVTVEGITDAQLNIETGTDAPVRSAETLQSTPPINLNNPSFVSTQDAGSAAPREDNSPPTANGTSQMINASFNQRIIPEPNVLDEYASYTYALSWYLLTPDQYKQMIVSQKKNTASWQLLMQSGGAPQQTSGGATAGRNQYFSLDYYFDDLEIDSLVPLKGTNAANTATDIRFRVTEPSGISLLQNLYKAVSTVYKQKNVSTSVNYPMAQYCMVVRFYGYNDNGELVTTGRRGTNGQTNLTDPRAIVEKFYPFVIANIKFRAANKQIEYEVQGKPIPHFYNKSQDRGTIPFAFELAGETAGQVLIGKPVGTQYPNDDGRRDSPEPNTSSPTNVTNTDENTAGDGSVDVSGIMVAP